MSWSARAWPLAIAGVLGVTVIANGYLIYQANDRDAAVVEPDYYRKALAWDSTLAERRHDADLGWRIEASIGPVGRGADVRARLTDRDGRAIEGASVVVHAIHNLDAGHPVVATLPDAGDGLYVARLPLRFAGLWELRFAVTRRGEHFTADARCDAPRAAP